MKKIVSSIFLLTLILSIISSCKKYEEGPALSFRSKKARLENKWKYDEISINEEKQLLSAEELEYRISFDKEDIVIKQTSTTSGPVTFVGKYSLMDDKEKIKTTFDYTYFGNPVHEVNDYVIVKLKHKELWLREYKASGDTCEYHFIPE
jgi:hypothetical protein